MSKRVVAIVLTILLLVAPIEEPLFCSKTKAAEIGMVGALPGSVTLWEIFQTIFAAAGIIVANDNIQSAASTNLGSSAYTLEEMERLGFIRIPTDGSSALDWDWSGLEDELQGETEDDAKIIRNVFSQNGGQGSGGSDEDPDQDPWYKKALNWVKYVVAQGKVKATDILTSANDSVTYNLSALAAMMGAAYNNNVAGGLPVDTYIPTNFNPAANFTVSGDFVTGTNPTVFQAFQTGQGTISDAVNCKAFTFFSYNESLKAYNLGVCFGNRSNNSVSIAYNLYRGGIVNTNLHMTNWNFTLTLNKKSKYGYKTLLSNLEGADALLNFENSEHCVSYNDAISKAEAWINSTAPVTIPEKYSPDIITPIGNAEVPASSPSWVPTPYLQPDKQLEIIPQPKIDEFTQYIIEEVPEFEPAGEAWKETVNPYIENEPLPTPTVRPRPTQSPEVTTIPGGDPGGEDNPINVTDPDPMPVIEGGFATTYGLMDFFPFCIPSDIVTIYKLFETEEDARAAPYIDWNIKIERFGVDEHIVLDFSIFDSSAEVCRILMFITFCFGLLLATKQLIWS